MVADGDTAALLAEMDATWSALQRRLAHLAEEETLPGEGEYPIAEVFAHLARWEERGAAFLEARARGERLPDDTADYRELNQRWAEEDRGMALPAARDRAGRAWRRYRTMLDELGGEAWDDEVLERAQSDLEHHREHLAEPLAFPVS